MMRGGSPSVDRRRSIARGLIAGLLLVSVACQRGTPESGRPPVSPGWADATAEKLKLLKIPAEPIAGFLEPGDPDVQQLLEGSIAASVLSLGGGLELASVVAAHFDDRTGLFADASNPVPGVYVTWLVARAFKAGLLGIDRTRVKSMIKGATTIARTTAEDIPRRSFELLYALRTLDVLGRADLASAVGLDVPRALCKRIAAGQSADLSERVLEVELSVQLGGYCGVRVFSAVRSALDAAAADTPSTASNLGRYVQLAGASHALAKAEGGDRPDDPAIRGFVAIADSLRSGDGATVGSIAGIRQMVELEADLHIALSVPEIDRVALERVLLFGGRVSDQLAAADVYTSVLGFHLQARLDDGRPIDEVGLGVASRWADRPPRRPAVRLRDLLTIRLGIGGFQLTFADLRDALAVKMLDDPIVPALMTLLLGSQECTSGLDSWLVAELSPVLGQIDAVASRASDEVVLYMALVARAAERCPNASGVVRPLTTTLTERIAAAPASSDGPGRTWLRLETGCVLHGRAPGWIAPPSPRPGGADSVRDWYALARTWDIGRAGCRGAWWSAAAPSKDERTKARAILEE